MQILVNKRIKFVGAPPNFVSWVEQTLTINNPEFQMKVKKGHDTRACPRTLSFARWGDDGHLTAPRGFVGLAARKARRLGIKADIVQELREKNPIEYRMSPKLRDEQQKAIDAILPFQFATLNAPTGSGKTVVALAYSALRKQPTLVVVHTMELLGQWIERAIQFLGLDRREIGEISGRKKTLGERLTIATYQSLRNLDDTDIVPHFGLLIIDEVHRCPSTTFTEVVERFDTKYQLGLSATPYRRDGLSRLIGWYIGEIKHSVPKDKLLAKGKLVECDVFFRRTAFVADVNPQDCYAEALTQLCYDPERNDLIVADIVREISAAPNERILVLSERVIQARGLEGMLEGLGITTGLLVGEMNKAQRSELRARIDDVQVLFATGSLVGEGFDLPALSTLFLVTPIKWAGRLIQYIGRILRPCEGKARARIFDYVDTEEIVFHKQALARMQVYSREPGIYIAQKKNLETGPAEEYNC